MQTVLASSATGGEGDTQERAEAEFLKSFSMLDPKERADLIKVMLDNLAQKTPQG